MSVQHTGNGMRSGHLNPCRMALGLGGRRHEPVPQYHHGLLDPQDL